MKYKPEKYLIITVVSFGLIYSLISIANHYNFRTYALDLGVYTNAIYKYAHFQLADNLTFKDGFEYLLGDHFDLYLVLFSPLVYIFQSYTLLVIQIASVLFGGLGVYKYFSLTGTGYKFTALFAAIYFFSFYGIFSAMSFDYHSNVVAAMLIPWFFYFLKKRDFLLAALLTFLVLISKENMALWMIFICMGLAFEYRKDRQTLTYLSGFAIFSIAYFLVVIYVIMPMFTLSKEYNGFHYSVLGDAPLCALKNLLLHPIDNLIVLFTNHNNTLGGDYVKLEMHLLVITSGAFMLLLKPYYLLILVPIYFQKLFHDNYLMWGIDGQYSIEFAPILALGIFASVNEFKSKRSAQLLTAIVLFGVLLSTVRVMDRTVIYTNKSKIRFYKPAHYERNYDVKTVHQILKQIPGDAIVSAQSPFVPHLALRDKIYQFPLVRDAEYIVLSEKEGKYPLDEASFKVTVSKMMMSGEWGINYENEDLVILRRKTEVRSQKTEDRRLKTEVRSQKSEDRRLKTED